jgi:outer membrane protein
MWRRPLPLAILDLALAAPAAAQGPPPPTGLRWSLGLVDYYYGVRPDEALPDRPAYEGEAMITTRASLSLLWRASPRIAVLALVRADRVDDDVQNSPIVDERRAVFGMAGFAYRF